MNIFKHYSEDLFYRLIQEYLFAEDIKKGDNNAEWSDNSARLPPINTN